VLVAENESVLVLMLIRGANNHSPTRQMLVENWQVKIPTHSSVWRGVFSYLTDLFYIFDQLFSDLAIENTELLASLASVLKTLSTPLC
jgi:hypothetical protein